MSSKVKDLKMVVVGENGVGKTCTLISFSTGSFPDDYVPTVFDNYTASIKFKGTSVNLGLWDTAGQEDYDRLRPLSYPCTDVFLIMFDVTNGETLSKVKTRWLKEIQEHTDEAVPMILVGNKTDISSRQVSSKEGEKVANEIGAFGYFEISAKDGINLHELFDGVIESVLEPKEQDSNVDGIGLLKKENENLKVVKLEKELMEMKEMVETMQETMMTLMEKNELLQKENEELREEVTALRSQIQF